jgi:hypothetical protein
VKTIEKTVSVSIFPIWFTIVVYIIYIQVSNPVYAGRDYFCHSADMDYNFSISLSELLRVIQIYNYGEFHCNDNTEDGYALGKGDTKCMWHDSDYSPQDWKIELNELLRLIQYFNSTRYAKCDDFPVPKPPACNCSETEDTFCLR